MMARRSGRNARLAFAAALAAALGSASPAPASDLALVWEAPAECPSAELVRRHVLRRIGAEHAHTSLQVRATVTRDAEAFRVRLETHGSGRRGVRELSAPTCSALVDALAVIVAMAVDAQLPTAEGTPRNESEATSAPREGLGTSSGGPSSPATQGAVAGASSGSGDAESEEAARPFRDLGLQGLASLAGSVESGILPGLGFGITARGGARLRRFRAEAAISKWFAREASSVQPGSGADIHGMALAVWACFRAVPAHTAPVPGLRSALPPDDSPAIEAGPCLGAELGQLSARSFGVAEPSDRSGGYFAAGGALRVGATAADWLSLDVRFEAFRILHAPEFRVENLGIVHEPSDWSLRAALGAEAYFP